MIRLGYPNAMSRRAATGARSSPRRSAQRHPTALVGIHLNMPIAAAATGHVQRPHRRRSSPRSTRWRNTASGSRVTQARGHPPADRRLRARRLAGGLGAWIVEKFWKWTDCDGHPENVLTRDELLDDVCCTGSRPPGRRRRGCTGRASPRSPNGSPGALDTVGVPTGCSIFPKEISALVAALGGEALHRHPCTGTSWIAAGTLRPSNSRSSSWRRCAGFSGWSGTTTGNVRGRTQAAQRVGPAGAATPHTVGRDPSREGRRRHSFPRGLSA